MQVVTIPCFQDNYAYLVVCPETRRAAVVDPSDGAAVLDEIRRRELVLEAILCTHHHADHTAGNEELARQVPGIRVYGHPSDPGRIPGRNAAAAEGEGIPVGRLEGRAIHTPGHTRDGVSYLFEDALFTGDTLFAAGCGRLFEGTPAEMYRSLNEKLARGGPETRVFFGHEYTKQNLLFARSVEPDNTAVAERLELVRGRRRQGIPTTPTTLAIELETNPFLRCDAPGVLAAVREADPGTDLSPVSVFRVLRALKDRF